MYGYQKTTDTLVIFDNPFQTGTTYEQELEENLPIPPKYLPRVKKKGLIFNDQIGKYIQVE